MKKLDKDDIYPIYYKTTTTSGSLSYWLNTEKEFLLNFSQAAFIFTLNVAGMASLMARGVIRIYFQAENKFSVDVTVKSSS